MTKLTTEQMREYQRERRAKAKAATDADGGNLPPVLEPDPRPPKPKRVPGPKLPEDYIGKTIDTPEQAVHLLSTLKRQRGRPRLGKGGDGDRLGDGLPDTSALIQNMTQPQRGAILDRVNITKSRGS